MPRATTFTQAGLGASQPLSQQFSQPQASQSDVPLPSGSPAPLNATSASQDAGAPHVPSIVARPSSSQAARGLLATLHSGPANSCHDTSQQEAAATPAAAPGGTLQDVLAAVTHLTERFAEKDSAKTGTESIAASGEREALQAQLNTLSSKIDQVRPPGAEFCL